MPDREKVINGLREMSCRATWKDIDRIRHKYQPIINDAIALLKEQPEIIRCKDCKYGSLYCTEDVCGETLIECNRPDLGDVIEIHGWKWFCADGERKGE